MAKDETSYMTLPRSVVAERWGVQLPEGVTVRVPEPSFGSKDQRRAWMTLRLEGVRNGIGPRRFYNMCVAAGIDPPQWLAKLAELATGSAMRIGTPSRYDEDAIGDI